MSLANWIASGGSCFVGRPCWCAGDPARARRELEVATRLAPGLCDGFTTATLLDLVLRIDAGEIRDSKVRLPTTLPYLRSRSLGRLAEGFLAVNANPTRARECLVPLSDHPLLEPFRRELRRRLGG